MKQYSRKKQKVKKATTPVEMRLALRDPVKAVQTGIMIGNAILGVVAMFNSPIRLETDTDTTKTEDADFEIIE